MRPININNVNNASPRCPECGGVLRRLQDGEVACTRCGLVAVNERFSYEGLELFDSGEDYENVNGRILYASEVESAAVWGGGLGSSPAGLPLRLRTLHEEASERRVERELKRLLMKKVYFPYTAEGRLMSDRAARLALTMLRELERKKLGATRRDLEGIVEAVAKRLGLLPRKRGRGRRRKLSDEQVRELLELRRRGLSLRQLAARFNVSPATVKRYLRRAGSKLLGVSTKNEPTPSFSLERGAEGG